MCVHVLAHSPTRTQLTAAGTFLLLWCHLLLIARVWPHVCRVRTDKPSDHQAMATYMAQPCLYSSRSHKQMRHKRLVLAHHSNVHKLLLVVFVDVYYTESESVNILSFFSLVSAQLTHPASFSRVAPTMQILCRTQGKVWPRVP